MNIQLAAAAKLSLERMENDALAAANNALSWLDAIPENSPAFAPFKDALLIDENGKPYDKQSLAAALSLEINERLDAGTFK